MRSEKMNSTQKHFLSHRFRQLFIYCLLLVSSLKRGCLMAEGRPIHTPQNSSQRGIAEEEKMVGVEGSAIGSRPPRCDGRCSSCGHCEAIQVPVSPIVQEGHDPIKRRFSPVTSTIANHRGDGISNYKPMSWKCKCGDFIFNP